MHQVILVIIPIFLLIAAGHVFRRNGFPGEGFWEPAEKLTYYVLFPALLVRTLAAADLERLEALPMIGAIAGATLIMTAGLLGQMHRQNVPGPVFTSLYQGAVRMNTYIGLTVAFGLHGEAGLTAAALAVATIVPLVNVLSVIMFARYASTAPPGAVTVAKQVVLNPLILGCLVGLAMNLTGVGLPPVIGPVLDLASRAALPLGLLAVGAALRRRNLALVDRGVFINAALKLLVLPGLTGCLLALLGVSGVAAVAAVLFNALPTAPAAYILARRLGGDATLMSVIVTVQTLLSMITLPVVLAVSGLWF